MGKLDLYEWLEAQHSTLKKQVEESYDKKIEERLNVLKEQYHVNEEALRISELGKEIYDGHLKFCEQFDCSSYPKDKNTRNQYPYYEMNGYGSILYTVNYCGARLNNSVESLVKVITDKINWRDDELGHLREERFKALCDIDSEYNKLMAVCKSTKSLKTLAKYLSEVGFDKTTVESLLFKEKVTSTALSTSLNINFLIPKNQEENNG